MVGKFIVVVVSKSGLTELFVTNEYPEGMRSKKQAQRVASNLLALGSVRSATVYGLIEAHEVNCN